jgi:hypothetical protein
MSSPLGIISLHIPTHPDSRYDNIRTGIPGYPDKSSPLRLSLNS